MAAVAASIVVLMILGNLIAHGTWLVLLIMGVVAFATYAISYGVSQHTLNDAYRHARRVLEIELAVLQKAAGAKKGDDRDAIVLDMHGQAPTVSEPELQRRILETETQLCILQGRYEKQQWMSVLSARFMGWGAFFFPPAVLLPIAYGIGYRVWVQHGYPCRRHVWSACLAWLRCEALPKPAPRIQPAIATPESSLASGRVIDVPADDEDNYS